MIGRMTKNKGRNPSKNAKKGIGGEWIVDKVLCLVLNLHYIESLRKKAGHCFAKKFSV